MHMACTHHAHTGHAHTVLMAHMGAPQTPPQNKCHSATKPQSLLATGEARPLRLPKELVRWPCTTSTLPKLPKEFVCWLLPTST